MKIRNDFVSNSSSSSFMIVGSVISRETALELAKKLGIDVSDDYYEAIEELCSIANLEYRRGISDYSDEEWCVGLPYNRMKENETRKEFEDRIAISFKQIGVENPHIEEMVDGGYDG